MALIMPVWRKLDVAVQNHHQSCIKTFRGLKSLFVSSTPIELSRIHNGHASCVSFEQMLGALSEERALAVAGGRMLSVRENMSEQIERRGATAI